MKPTSLQEQFKQLANKFLDYRIPMFILLLVILYGFIILRINTLSNVQPKTSISTTQTNSLTPSIDQSTINKITQLHDNSVSVQALFSQARQNPFQE